MTIQLGKFDCSTGHSNLLYRNGDLTVRTATAADKTFIDKLQKENSYAVGFIQATVWDKYVFGGERNFVVFICEKNADMVGYVLLTPGRAVNTYAKIQQIAVREDARRLDYGSALLAVVKDFCNTFGRLGVTLRCRVDLESNYFWKALGFRLYDVWEKGKINHVGFKASNDINLWSIDLNDDFEDLFGWDETTNGLFIPEKIQKRKKINMEGIVEPGTN
ncbi:MAG: GNAT family N-acetyltransferase [Caulobacteraceae bacterium]|nr:GNAT family N-acetyltransferase [Caulobacteraceae bacterium]